ncbi:MAG: hypothetical protein HKN67_01400 [Saprospiraceae bacterium]|nr:hypothetical protein [Bacteroidia bacterium]MBT8230654.1 hypothetical protein [Bacteroidia bacterium]NNF20569.1 hypothetical protein [Saprospiraceae bacterium]
MNVGNANLLNALTLIGIGIWGFKTTGSKTALIPVIFGVVLLVLTNSVRSYNKAASRVALVFTLLVLVALVGMRLPKSLEQGGPGLYRVIAMIATGVIALIAFLKSAIDSKRGYK